MTNKQYDYIIHTDGGYSRKYNVGAFAFVICDRSDMEIKRGAWKIENETNNRAELKAIIAALNHVPSKNCSVLVISDSQYALMTLSGKWSRNSNTDLFPIHDRIVNENGLDVDYKWVKGHSGDTFNEICDELCNQAVGFNLNEEYVKYKRQKA